MARLFGTDGVRGVANGKVLNAELAYKLGRAAAQYFGREVKSPKIIIGRDTRLSGTMLEAALAAGICSAGGNAHLLGVIPTPAVSFLTEPLGANAGVVISASHNPFEDNGIKFFAHSGFKLPDAVEDEIEAIVNRPIDYDNTLTGSSLGRVYTEEDKSNLYVQHVVKSADCKLNGLKVVMDCANGANSEIAPMILRLLGAQVIPIFNNPNGININNGCGSTHLDQLKAMVKAGGYDLGIAFDGDADRCLMVDEAGEEIDGDQVIAACGLALKEAGELAGGAIVGTVMSNLGLHRFCKEHGIGLFCTSVGDRNVLEKMEECGYVIGGEQSGHTIFRRYATTGDGQLTALQFLDLLCRSGKKASELVGECKRYPQVLINVPVADKAKKEAVLSAPALQSAVAEQEEKLAGNGRVLVRPSGTEALIRVMVEAQTEPVARETAELLANVIKNHGS